MASETGKKALSILAKQGDKDAKNALIALSAIVWRG